MKSFPERGIEIQSIDVGRRHWKRRVQVQVLWFEKAIGGTFQWDLKRPVAFSSPVCSWRSERDRLAYKELDQSRFQSWRCYVFVCILPLFV